ncbi:MAG: hypothetical protein HPY66_1464 [Firmicutes bacterium]|nr:hypothetical protein [Bacillota bacterium]
MEVVSLIGASGTGKSYRALMVAKEKGIEVIIDDGLLIQGNKIVAGTSAKKEPTKVAAVRRALFMDYQHRKDVADAITRLKPEKVLILSTSDRMSDRITEALGLPPVSDRVYIHHVATQEEISLAKRQRIGEGKHVIPVPTFEIKKDFSGYFIDTLKIIKSLGKNPQEQPMEKSVVRPTYSYRGRYTISNGVITTLVQHAIKKIPKVSRTGNIIVNSTAGGMIIDLEIIITYGHPIRDTVLDVQRRIIEEVEYMTSINVMKVNVLVKSIVV